MYRLPFELTDCAKLLHFTILGGGGSADPLPPLNDATVRLYFLVFSHFLVSEHTLKYHLASHIPLL